MVWAGVRRAVRESVAGMPPQFWWLWTSTLVNRLGGFVATFLVLYLTAEQGHSASFAGFVVSLYGFGGVVGAIGGGIMADRLGRRPTLLVTQLASAVAVGVLGFVQHPAAIAAVAALVGVVTTASRPAVQAMMADIVPPEDRVRAYSLNYWAINLGFAVSATAAGFIAEYSYLIGFLGEAVMTLACAIIVFVKLPESRPEQPGGKGADPAETSVSMWSVARDGKFMSLVGLWFLLALIFTQGYVGLPLAMGDDGFSSSQFGLVMAFNGVLIVALQIPVTRFIEHRDPRPLLIASALLAGYGYGLTAFAGSMAFYALTVAVWTLGEMISAPTQAGLVVRLSPLHGRGRYQGVHNMTWSVATLVAPLMAGLVIDRYGAEWLWAMCAALGTVAAAGYWVLMRRLGAGEDAGPVAEGTAKIPGLVETPGLVPVTEPAAGEPEPRPAHGRAHARETARETAD
ncbi:MFS transporter [Streptomyces sp. NPDC020875]|uniref:MDR family MFS transporter n=1 Tax=Streptomyces sp. NPDC020875 TaxID=3154898 RepID=UPI0033F7E501